MDRTKVPQDAWTQFALSVFELNGHIIAAGETIARSVGQSSARWQVLGTTFEPRTVPQIARDLGLSRQGVQRVADVLEGEGLVASRPHPNDQRTALFELTASGHGVMSQLYQRHLAWSLEVLKKVDSARLRHVTALMDEVAAVLADTPPLEK
jgi:DNA-binding MarR family transcriptional regulator